MANPRARSRLNAPSTECRCQPVASTSSSAVAPCLLARAFSDEVGTGSSQKMRHTNKDGRRSAPTCRQDAVWAERARAQAPEQLRVFATSSSGICLMWPSGGPLVSATRNARPLMSARFQQDHHPKPRSRSPGRFPRPAQFDFRGPASRRQYRSNRRRSPDIKDRVRSSKATASERGASPPRRRRLPGSATDALGDAKSQELP